MYQAKPGFSLHQLLPGWEVENRDSPAPQRTSSEVATVPMADSRVRSPVHIPDLTTVDQVLVLKLPLKLTGKAVFFQLPL